MRGKAVNIRFGISLLTLLVLSGCSLIPELSPRPTNEPVNVPQLPPSPNPVPEESTPLPPVTESTPQPEPAPLPPAPEPAPVEPPRVAVVLSNRLPDYESVAAALRERLNTLDVYDLSDKSLTPRETVDSIRAAKTEVVIAIGYRAAVFATGIDDLPVVYSQVFNTDQLDLSPDRVRGVSMLPPLSQQLAAWKDLNPNLTSVGAIVGPGHELLLDEAREAAADHEVRFQSRLAGSDRETLYLFTRLVPQIDGFWLFPDNRILSADVLRQMLDYAARHRVQVAVFNDSLLSIGATLSTTAVDDDIADTILEVANSLLSNDGAPLPVLSPLSAVEVRTGDAQVVQSEAAKGPAGDGC